MGDVVRIEDHRARREAAAAGRPVGAGGERRGQRPATAFAFDLSSPWTYFAAERVDRMFSGLRWQPVLGEAVHAGAVAGAPPWEREAVMEAAQQRAAQLRMPLSWPDGFPDTGRAAMRVAAYAGEQGKGGVFAVAASRLAFCGGFDLDDPEILAEAAAAASLGLDACLRAARDPRRDGAMEAQGRALLSRGADRLPALSVGRLVFAGEDRIAEAAAAARNPLAVPRERPRAREAGPRPSSAGPELTAS